MAPTGGKKDTTPPKLLSVNPPDSLLNTKVKKIILRFDEYITVADVTKEVQISPILPVLPTVTGKNKEVTVKIIDSLLEDNTTYRISFGKAIKDLHEANPFTQYTYVFSTGSYFDSLELQGKVINALTGLPDTGLVYIVLYSIKRPDSAVVREKPKYITTAAADGSFSLKGLPAQTFRIYALKDQNNNLIYDGGDELIAFSNSPVRPGDTSLAPISLRLFKETDTARKKDDTVAKPPVRTFATGKNAKEGFTYEVAVDTSDRRIRTFEITKPIKVVFNKEIGSILKNKITLSYDSAGQNANVPVIDSMDSVRKKLLLIPAQWLENTVYTLRLPKGFAKDTGTTEALPSRYVFRTKREDDYGKLQIHLPSKYYSKQFLLLVNFGTDTVYNKPVTDTVINLNLLTPGSYSLRIIIDKNGNGKWDPGDLFRGVQPEVVVPYENKINLKAGWENIIDFEPKPAAKPQLPKEPKGKAEKSKPK